MKWRRTISLGLAAAMTASTVLAGCGGDSGANGNASSGDNKNQTAATEEGGSQASGDVTTIEVYDFAERPTPIAIIKGTVMGPVVTPPESNATAIKSAGAAKERKNSAI